MQNCLQCGERLKYKQVLKSLIGFIGYTPVRCIHCGQNHRITFESRVRISIAIVVIPISLRLLFYNESSAVDSLLFILIWAVLMLFTLPYLTRYHRKN